MRQQFRERVYWSFSSLCHSTDALCNGELGVLVNPDDVNAIAQTLIQILQGTYPNALIYQPQALRQKVIDTFGFMRFQQTLAELMKNFLL